MPRAQKKKARTREDRKRRGERRPSRRRSAAAASRRSRGRWALHRRKRRQSSGMLSAVRLCKTGGRAGQEDRKETANYPPRTNMGIDRSPAPVKLPAHSSRAPSKPQRNSSHSRNCMTAKALTSARTMVRPQNLEPCPDPKSSPESKVGRIQAVDLYP